MKAAAIIGAGIGGLATAIHLIARGYRVDVYEKEDSPGGKLGEKWMGEYRFDLGPSLFTQPERVEELFRILGEEPSNYFTYNRLDTICRYFWADGSSLDVPSDPVEFAREGGQLMPSGEKILSEYLASARALYEAAGPVFLDQPFPSMKAMTSPGGIRIGKNPMILDPLVSMHHRNSKFFTDPRLVQLFDRYATYNGSNPYKAPATLRLIAHLEHNMGAFFPAHGMYSITQAVRSLAERHGARFHFGSRVEKILRHPGGRRVRGVRVNGEELEYPLVVSDVDVHTLYRTGITDAAPPLIGRRQELSTSALIFYWGIRTTFPGLELHNILFSSEYREEFRHLFDLKMIGPDPTVYIFISSKQVPEDAPAGSENWFVMVNAPENIGQDWDTLVAQTRQVILKKIQTMLGISLEGQIVCEHVEDPRTIESRTGSWHGALYGNSSNSRMSAFSRHPNHRSKIKGLYFTGGSVHPGGGIPLCLASAAIVAGLIDENEKHES